MTAQQLGSLDVVEGLVIGDFGEGLVRRWVKSLPSGQFATNADAQQIPEMPSSRYRVR